MLLIWFCAAAVYYQLSLDNLDTLLWFIALLVQSIPYLAALIMSIISALPNLNSKIIIHAENLSAIKQTPVNLE